MDDVKQGIGGIAAGAAWTIPPSLLPDPTWNH
jgi:hypothetical protein